MNRTSRWDRPPAPRDFRGFLRLVGKILICSGLLMFGFVAYQLWGTGIEYARAQNRAENQFEEMMAAVSSVSATSPTGSSATSTTATLTPTTAPQSSPASTTSSPSTTSTSTSTTTAPTTVPDLTDIVAAMNITDGEAFARLEIPSIGLDVYIYPGVTREDLQKGPGHFPNTPMPGMLGNSALAGHRTTYGHPFLEIDQVEPGDEIIVTVPYGRFVYAMTSSEIVEPSDTQVIDTTDPGVATFTLTTCHPAYSASQRYIVYSELDLAQSTAPGQPIFNYGRDQPAPTDVGLPGEETPASTTTSTSSTASNVPPESITALGGGGGTIPTSTTSVTSTTAALPTTTATPDPLYNVVPGEGFTGGGGSSADGEAFSNRWFSDKDALPQVAIWALCCMAIVVGAYRLAKFLRNSWIGLAAGIVPFLAGLYFFYENVNRLLPAAL